MTNNHIILRAHHLLCIQGFQGYGYSSGFVKHMQDVVSKLKDENNPLVMITSSNDIICEGCFNHKDYKCIKDEASDEIIKEMDLAVLSKMGLEAGYTDNYSHLLLKVNETFKTRLELIDICGDCLWTEKCLWYLSRK